MELSFPYFDQDIMVWRPQQPARGYSAVGMLRLMTLIAALTAGALAIGLWQVQKTEQHLPSNSVVEAALEAIEPTVKQEVAQSIVMGDDSRREQATGVARVVAINSGGGKVALSGLALMRADPAQLFAVSADADRVPKLRSDYLDKVRDYNRVGSFTSNEDEAAAYCDALIKSNRTPQSVFAKNARRDLTFVHLFEEPAKYRGDVVHIRGRIRMLSRYDPPLMARQAGVKDLYEAWIFDEQRVANPYCVLVTELPAGMTASGRVDYDASFDGYFFKRYRYKSVDSEKANQFRDAPLLIGRTFTLNQPIADAAGDETSWASWLSTGFMALLAASTVLVIGLTWWFRREDRLVRQRVEVAHSEFVEPQPDDIPPLARPVSPSERISNGPGGEQLKSNHYTHGHDKARAVHRSLGQGGIDSS